MIVIASPLTHRRTARVGRGCAVALGLALCVFAAMVRAGDNSPAAITVRQAQTRLVDGVYRLDASIDYRFSTAVREALKNGVPLTVVIQIEVRRPRWWWWDEVVASLSQFYLLQYHALSRQYLLTSLNTGVQQNFATLGAALTALGTLRDVPILDSKLLDANEHYRVRLRAQLDIESLPSPLRPLAYISSDWRLQSDWYVWPLHS